MANILQVGVDKTYKTIQAAVNVIPDMMDNDYTIEIDSGTYAEDVEIRNKRGYIVVLHNVTEDYKTPVIINSVSIIDCVALTRVQYCTFNATVEGKTKVKFERCSYGSVDFCEFKDVKNVQCIEHYSSLGSITGNVFTNVAECIKSSDNSYITVRNDNFLDIDNPPRYYLISNSSIVTNLTGNVIPLETKNKTERGGVIL